VGPIFWGPVPRSSGSSSSSNTRSETVSFRSTPRGAFRSLRAGDPRWDPLKGTLSLPLRWLVEAQRRKVKLALAPRVGPVVGSRSTL
jgi:hypothetical protein